MASFRMHARREYVSNEGSKERRIVHYGGSVQGVGFRYTTIHLAQQYRVTGFVQNLPDGRVCIVAEGERAELDRFLKRVLQTMKDYVATTDVETDVASGEFTGFTIRY